jgi:hypothetical protein
MIESTSGDQYATLEEPVTRPGYRGERPLELLVLGGVLAAGTFLAVLVIAYKASYVHELSENTAIFISGFLFFIYTGGVYIFCHGWERGDTGKAVRLTVIVVVLSAVAVLIAAVAFAVLSKAKGGVAEAAGDATEGAGGEGGEGVNLGFLRVLGSYVKDGSIDTEAAREEPRPQSDLFTITCWKCNQDFIPLPPRAECPNCGWTAVTVA